jgi:starch phosphorylase
VCYDVGFYGRVEKRREGDKEICTWIPAEIVKATAYDTPVPGFDTFNTINLRLWRSSPANMFDFDSFNKGDYWKAIE